jgi:hypothetical protein
VEHEIAGKGDSAKTVASTARACGRDGDTPLSDSAHGDKLVIDEGQAASWQRMPPRRWSEIAIRLKPRPTA